MNVRRFLSPLWDDLVSFIENKTGDIFDLPIYQKMFGLEVEEYELNLLIFCLNFISIECKFQNNSQSFQSYRNLIEIKINSEYKIAESKGKLSKHFKNFF